MSWAVIRKIAFTDCRRCGLYRLLLAITLASLMIVSAFAQGSPKQAPTVVEQCLKHSLENGGKGFECLGQVTATCLGNETKPGDDLIHECYQQEYVQWNLMLSKQQAALKRRLKTNALKTHQSAHKSWKIYRSKACRLMYKTLDEGAALVEGLSCNRDITARRSIDLARLILQLP